MRFVLLLLPLLLLLSACAPASGGGDGSSGGTASSSDKALFSLWTLSTDSTAHIDLRNASLNASGLFFWTYAGGANCSFVLTINGTESAANGVLSNGVYINGGAGDPNCGAKEGTYTLTKTATTLTVCTTTNVCNTFE